MRLVVFHETTHALGFAGNMYRYYQTEDLQPRNYLKTVNTQLIPWFPYYRTELTLPTALKYAKQHFNCSKMKGIALETSGG